MPVPARQLATSDRSFGDLLRDLSGDMVLLVRQEMRLARKETAESLHTLGSAVAQLAAGLVFATCALGAAATSLILLLSHYLLDGMTWLAALIVALALGGGAGLFAWRAVPALIRTNFVPDETTTSLKETAVWLTHPTTSAANSR